MGAGYVFSYSNRKGMMAQEKNHALQALAGSIAHEMRNPLGQVKYSFESILQDLPIYHPGAPAECISSQNLDRVYLRVAQGQMAVNRGVQVIEMILDEVKNKPIDTQGFTLLSAASVTRKALDEYGYESDAERKKISFDSREDFLINADETMYVFVLFNLIMNAFYFIKPYPEGRIVIRQEKGRLQNRIYVRDTGPGIPPENIDKLFNPFFTSGKKGGTGLGLAYCKRVMRAFSGDIACSSVYGSYTEFMLSFPVVSDNDLAEFRRNIVDRYLELFRDKRILLVDDEVQDREPVRTYLEPFEVEIDEAGDGLEALEKAKGRRYDAVLMNLSMPKMNGYEATEAIRTGQAGAFSQKVPIIGHTAAPTYIARGKTEKIGMQGFISKPVSEPELIELLGKVFSGYLNGRDSDLSGLTVMLVDDSSFNRLALRGILEKCNIRVIEAVNGKAAIARVRDEHCNLILMDIQMPELNGVETTRVIRAKNFNGNRNIPIIGLSGESDEEFIEAALDAGMNDYLHKPVSSALLLSKIEEWIVV
ncbi:ATP-binding response regulator [Prosthecochloris sp. GSB1]|uniref:ATP-binding response regulator n=1 Tax=Prosthecochloris sp. GSB1 TaxID=281093 RepID=UPI001EEE87BD|nr:response regulator [Prosthecochloris sp. GSB1]